ncbi:MAG: hypothetical protein R2729_07465 [Bryobacteraceae bacterium]
MRMFALLPAAVLLAQPPEAIRLTDPVTGRHVTRYASPHHETHHYYDIQPWSPDGKRVLFFRFDADVAKLSATGRYPGRLMVMDDDGRNAHAISGTLQGHYHVGVNQFWGPGGKTVYYSEGGKSRVIDLASGESREIPAPVQANRMSPDFTKISCVRGPEWGLFDVASGKYEKLVTHEQALAISPARELVRDVASGLQNTRFNPKGGEIIIVNAAREEFPRLVEMYLYNYERRELKHLAAQLHHPGWRPDGKAVLFLRRRVFDNFQSLYEVDTATGAERVLSGKHHVPGGHPSYHPLKPHLIVTDCYGGPLGYGIALLNTQTGELKQLVTIPTGARPAGPADDRFPFRNWGLWMPQRPYLNEPRPVWSPDGKKLLYTSEESGRMNLYVVDTGDL